MKRGIVLGTTAILLGMGCVRHVTKDPDLVERLNDSAWKITRRPSAPPPAAYEAPPEGAPAETATVPVVPVVPLRPAPWRERPEVQRAMRTPRDALGVPTGLYAVDPLLSLYRKDMEAQADARQQVGVGSMIFGAIFGALSVWAIYEAKGHVGSLDPDVRSSAINALVWGTAGGALSFGYFVTGLVFVSSSSNPAPLQSYYRETYGARP